MSVVSVCTPNEPSVCRAPSKYRSIVQDSRSRCSRSTIELKLNARTRVLYSEGVQHAHGSFRAQTPRSDVRVWCSFNAQTSHPTARESTCTYLEGRSVRAVLSRSTDQPRRLRWRSFNGVRFKPSLRRLCWLSTNTCFFRI